GRSGAPSPPASCPKRRSSARPNGRRSRRSWHGLWPPARRAPGGRWRCSSRCSTGCRCCATAAASGRSTSRAARASSRCCNALPRSSSAAASGAYARSYPWATTGGGFLTSDGSMTLAFASAYGGSTVVYTGTSLTAPERVIRGWGVPGLDHADLVRRSAKHAEQNSVHLLEESLINDNNRLFVVGGRAAG